MCVALGDWPLMVDNTHNEPRRSPRRSARHPAALQHTPAPAWSPQLLKGLLVELSAIRADVLALENECEQRLANRHRAYEQSARNLIHYLALRRHDVRELQEKLAALGLSSLGRTESHVLAGIQAVSNVLLQLAHRKWPASDRAAHLIDFAEGNALLRAHTEALLGPRPAKRSVRIMVTMPSEAAHDFDLVRQLVAHGMDCMRINCAHDNPEAWAGMLANLQRARQELSRDCRAQMDLAGPKLRTGALDPSSQIVKWRPQRDRDGRVKAPAQVWLTPEDRAEPPPSQADGCLVLPAAVLAQASGGDRLKFTDLRGKSRTIELCGTHGRSRWATSAQTAYLSATSMLPVTWIGKATRGAKTAVTATVASPPADLLFITLKPGDVLVLTRAPIPGRPAVYGENHQVVTPATISCTLPEVFADVRPQERIWFDDGKIGGLIESIDAGAITVRITTAKPAGSRLRADKGINLPDSNVRLPALTEKDIADLAFVVEHADLVGLSFVRRPDDVRALQAELARRNAAHLGIVLKIETRTAFEQLPAILLEAMRGQRAGVMIARGDLAVECGWERLAEIQEEMLWICEAAHIPVIWATQVLENLAKKGVPSRAEITDAAMGERAECVMLNKGPHLTEAVRVLDDILCRMEAHQSKKSARLRRLHLSAAMSA
jgi:pyruvate kinase